MKKTLYELLEALPDDDADGLRAAFRKAAKANHPDFNPGNAEASERFRRIIRANAILSDQRQRAEYDRLLELAKRQRSQPPQRRSRSATFRRLAADALTSAVVAKSTELRNTLDRKTGMRGMTGSSHNRCRE